MKKENKRIVLILLSCLFVIATLGLQVKALENETSDRIHDFAQLLSTSEYQELENIILETSQRQEFDIAILTQNDIDSPIQEYGDYMFEYFDYGFGENKDGVLLVVDMNKRDVCIITHGFGTSVYSDAIIEEVLDEVIPFLTEGEYLKAFKTFVEKTDEYLDMSKTSHDVKKPLSFTWIIISLVIGVIVGFIVTNNEKGKLKTVRKQKQASSYIKTNSLKVTSCDEQFLYKNTESHKKEKSSTTVHKTEKGNTFGGNSKKF